MIIECVCCGKEFVVYKGNCKYCPVCRDEIYSKHGRYGGYAKAARALCDKRQTEREKTKKENRLRKAPMSIECVVHEAVAHGRSYGHEVAVMEGREH